MEPKDRLNSANAFKNAIHVMVDELEKIEVVTKHEKQTILNLILSAIDSKFEYDNKGIKLKFIKGKEEQYF